MMILEEYFARIDETYMYIKFWWGNLRERNELERPTLRRENNIKMDL